MQIHLIPKYSLNKIMSHLFLSISFDSTHFSLKSEVRNICEFYNNNNKQTTSRLPPYPRRSLPLIISTAALAFRFFRRRRGDRVYPARCAHLHRLPSLSLSLDISRDAYLLPARSFFQLSSLPRRRQVPCPLLLQLPAVEALCAQGLPSHGSARLPAPSVVPSCLSLSLPQRASPASRTPCSKLAVEAPLSRP